MNFFYSENYENILNNKLFTKLKKKKKSNESITFPNVMLLLDIIDSCNIIVLILS